MASIRATRGIMVERLGRAMIRPGLDPLKWLLAVAIAVVLTAMAVSVRLSRLEEAKKHRAREDCTSWASAVESYKLKYGDWPPSLATLTQVQPDGAPSLMIAEALYDPWGHEYRYVATQRGQLVGPDIWSLGPRITDPSSIIGNWD
jgi:hypothetical protein